MNFNFSRRLRKRLEELCTQHRITIHELAEISNISIATIDKLYFGKTQRFSTSTMKKLCKGLSISLTEFYDSDIFI